MPLLRLLIGLGALLPSSAYAALSINACGTVPGLPCAAGGAAGAVGMIATTIIPALQGIFVAVALLFFFYYGARLMLESEDESTITETKSAYGYAVSGAAVVSLAGFIIDTAAIGSPTVVNPVATSNLLLKVVDYLLLITSAVVTAMMVFQGIRMIMLQGQDSEMEKQKTRFFHGLLGVAVILLAGPLVQSFLPGTAGSTILSVEIVGIINFLLQILGALSILGLVVAGIMLVVSTDESLKDRAKKLIFTTVIALIIVLCSYLIVRFVASL